LAGGVEFHFDDGWCGCLAPMLAVDERTGAVALDCYRWQRASVMEEKVESGRVEATKCRWMDVMAISAGIVAVSLTPNLWPRTSTKPIIPNPNPILSDTPC
jgi:hypothetical protein